MSAKDFPHFGLMNWKRFSALATSGLSNFVEQKLSEYFHMWTVSVIYKLNYAVAEVIYSYS